MFLDNLPAQISGALGLGVGSGAGFFIIKFIFEWLTKRIDRKEERLSLESQALDNAWKIYRQTLEGRIDEQDAKIKELVISHQDCTDKNIALQAQVTRLEATLSGFSEGRKLAAGVIALDRMEQIEEAEHDNYVRSEITKSIDRAASRSRKSGEESSGTGDE